MNRKLMAALFMTGAAAAAMAVPAAAQEQTVTSRSGIITITLPSEKWVEGASDNRCAVFSDGTDYIAFNHYKIGDDKPEIVSPQGEAYETYQTITTEKGYFLEVVGYCDDDVDLDAIKKAVNSSVFNMDRMHADTHKIVQDTMTVENTDMTMYCKADELNVRPDGAGTGDPIAVLHMGDSVHVTGIVKKNGVATGWMRIDNGGMTGYVCDAFLTYDKPAPVDPQKPSRTGNSQQIYYLNSNSVTVYEYTDGTWKDDNGVEYWRTVDREWASADGATLYDYVPDLPDGGTTKTGNSKQIYWLNGNSVTIYEYSDGKWFDDNGIGYFYQNGDDAWHSYQGDTLYDDPDALRNRPELRDE